jgi:hypothetical protein
LPQNHELFEVQYRGLRADALDALEPQLLNAVTKEAINFANFAPGEIRLVPWIDPQTGRKENRFYGTESFVKQMTRPGRRVVRFLAPADGHGRAVREFA